MADRKWKGGTVLFAGGTDWTQVRIAPLTHGICFLYKFFAIRMGRVLGSSLVELVERRRKLMLRKR